MPKNTLTFRMDGEVWLEDFERAIINFRKMIVALSEEVAPSRHIDWVVEDLRASSAIAVFRGKATHEVDEPFVARVVDAYPGIPEALKTRNFSRYSLKVLEPALSLSQMINERIQSVIFETEETEGNFDEAPTITAKALHQEMTPGIESKPTLRRGFGSIQGRVQTLSDRGGLRFTLFESMADKAVSCYLDAESKEGMREAWGKLCRIEGLVTRDVKSGRPMSIRQISNVTIIEPTKPDAYRAARGAVPRGPNSPLAEDAIRRTRDE